MCEQCAQHSAAVGRFRYHQIRKMLGLAFLTQRRSLPAETIDSAFAGRSKLRCAIDASHVAEECNIPKWPREVVEDMRHGML